MRHAGLEEAQAGIKIAGRNINMWKSGACLQNALKARIFPALNNLFSLSSNLLWNILSRVSTEHLIYML